MVVNRHRARQRHGRRRRRRSRDGDVGEEVGLHAVKGCVPRHGLLSLGHVVRSVNEDGGLVHGRVHHGRRRVGRVDVHKGGPCRVGSGRHGVLGHEGVAGAVLGRVRSGDRVQVSVAVQRRAVGAARR